MWDTLMDLFLLLAIGGWLMLWLLRELGLFGIRRGMGSAPRPTDPSSSPRGGTERIVPDGDQTIRQSPKNPSWRHGDKLSERPHGPGRRLGSGSRRRSRSARRQPARVPRPQARTHQRSSHLQAGPQQPSATPSSTRISRSNP